jgi:hypothetical protein
LKVAGSNASSGSGSGRKLKTIFNRFAEDKWKHRFDKTSKENYVEMGMVSISFLAYNRKNGQLAIDM